MEVPRGDDEVARRALELEMLKKMARGGRGRSNCLIQSGL